MYLAVTKDGQKIGVYDTMEQASEACTGSEDAGVFPLDTDGNLAVPDVEAILIMRRIHPVAFWGALQNGGSVVPVDPDTLFGICNRL